VADTTALAAPLRQGQMRRNSAAQTQGCNEVSMDQSPKSSPVLAGIALLGAGLLIRQWQPDALRLPEPENRKRLDRGLARAARKSRDGLAMILPSNLTGSIGRSLMVMGAGLLTLRALDFLADDNERLF
jgi:hypothetical protein